MMSPLRDSLAVIALAALAACSTTSDFGDAKLARYSDSVLVTPDIFYLPSFPIDRPGVYRFAVRDLPEPMVPYVVTVRPRSTGFDPRDAPWKELKLKVLFQSTDGRSSSDHTVRMARHDTGVWKQSVPIGEAAGAFRQELTEYDVVVEVERASGGPGDRAFLASHGAYGLDP